MGCTQSSQRIAADPSQTSKDSTLQPAQALELTVEEKAVAQLKFLFESIDMDSDKTVDRNEFQAALQQNDKIGALIAEAQFSPDSQVLDQLDTNKNGRVTWEEFEKHLRRAAVQQVEKMSVAVEAVVERKAVEALDARMWRVNLEQPDFPPSHRGIARGLCASGGGARAMTYNLGIYRALYDLGLLERLDAISSVSGGSWASSILMFANTWKGREISTRELLGKNTNPGELGMTVLNEAPAPFATALTSNWNDVFREQRGQVPSHELWQKVIGKWLLADFELDSLDALMAASTTDRDRIVMHNPGLMDKTFLVPRTDRPKTLVINGTWLAPVGYTANSSAVSLQMSPDWTGSPYYPDNEQVTYKPAFGSGYFCGSCDRTLTVGGGFVETFAFGGTPPEFTPPEATQKLPEQQEEQIRVGCPVPKPMSLAAAVGISSFAPGFAIDHLAHVGKLLNPEMVAWPIPSPSMPGPPRAERYECGDGGSLDNSGLLALLQRGADKVVWIASSFQSLSTSYDYTSATTETFDPDAAQVLDQVSGKFGYGEGTFSQQLTKNQVFKKSALLNVVRQLVTLKEAGQPAVARFSLEVLENPWWGITGGRTVELLLVYLEKTSDFEAQLPADTQTALHSADGPFTDYPIYKTLGENGLHNFVGLTACQVNLLAAQAEYTVRHHAELFREFLS